PLPLSYAILRQDGSVSLFIDRRKLAPGLDRHLGNAVSVEPQERLGPALDSLSAEGGRIQADPATAPSWIFDRLATAGAKIPPDRGAGGANHALLARFPRAIPRRHHRHHPHHHDRRTERGDARPLHPRAEGPHRARHRTLPEGHDRDAARRTRPPLAVASRAR